MNPRVRQGEVSLKKKRKDKKGEKLEKEVFFKILQGLDKSFRNIVEKVKPFDISQALVIFRNTA